VRSVDRLELLFGMFEQAFEESLKGRPAIHDSVLMRSFLIVAIQENIEIGLHLFDALINFVRPMNLKCSY